MGKHLTSNEKKKYSIFFKNWMIRRMVFINNNANVLAVIKFTGINNYFIIDKADRKCIEGAEP